MKKKSLLKLLYTLDIMLLLTFVAYKGYLLLSETEFKYANEYSLQKVEKNFSGGDFSFAVLGNIKNSVNIFDESIVQSINKDKDLSFAIANGNSLIEGNENNYRVFKKSLAKLNIPTIVAVGDNEVSDNGAFRFYEHFGPLYYSYSVGESYFIFLDTTGSTSLAMQKQWIDKELMLASTFKYRFVFMNKPPFDVKVNNFLDKSKQYIDDKEFSNYIQEVFPRYKVTAVFASGAEIFESKEINGVPYFISGGAGGSLILNNADSFYHYIKVSVTDNGIKCEIIKQDVESNTLLKRLELNTWFYIRSIFYLNYIYLLLILSVLILIATIINKYIYTPVDYYNEYYEPVDNKKKALTIAMFTNNYVPFIGGVPISIERLTKGLTKAGHQVIIFAPEYPGQAKADSENIIRCKLLVRYKSKGFNFHIVNIFSSDIEEAFTKYDFDVIHVHHPFWMGSKGLELGKKYDIPVVLTYHTRLEKYAHNLPFLKKTFENLLSHKIIKIFSQKCDAIVAPTNSAVEYLENIGVSRHKIVMPTGIDFDIYTEELKKGADDFRNRFTDRKDILLCSVSRLTKEKNLTFLIDGIKAIKNKATIPFKVIIVGDGPEKQYLIDYAKNKGLSDTISFLGSLPQDLVTSCYLASDIFVFSSLSETQGMVLLEAMAGGCPVVAIRSSGVDDVVIDDLNGYKTKGKVNLWAEKVLGLMEDPSLLQQMKVNAVEFAAKYSIEVMAKQTVEIYEAALHHKQIYLRNSNSSIGVFKRRRVKIIKGVTRIVKAKRKYK